MNDLARYHDPAVVSGLLAELEREAARLPRRITVMEVCGTHTHTVARAGLRHRLPPPFASSPAPAARCA